MADLVFAAGVPHTPAFPSMVARQGPSSPILAHYAQVRSVMLEARPDLIVLISTDHLNTFFFDNLPIFAIGVDEQFSGPNDDVPGLPRRDIDSDRGFANHLRASAIAAGFDLAHVEHCGLDHAFVVPLSMLSVCENCKIVPIFISGHVPPLPTAERCLRFGVAIKKAILSSPRRLRVGVIASGSFSLDVHGTCIEPDLPFGVPDLGWVEEVYATIVAGRATDLVKASTPQRLGKAGNVAGEILNWITMLACVGSQAPAAISIQREFGHGYAAWRLDAR